MIRRRLTQRVTFGVGANSTASGLIDFGPPPTNKYWLVEHWAVNANGDSGGWFLGFNVNQITALPLAAIYLLADERNFARPLLIGSDDDLQVLASITNSSGIPIEVAVTSVLQVIEVNTDALNPQASAITGVSYPPS